MWSSPSRAKYGTASKGHFYAGQFWATSHLWIGVPTALLAAIAGTAALAQFDNHNIVAGVLALSVAALSAISTFLNPNEKATTHHHAGNQYNSLRHRARIFDEIDLAVMSEGSNVVQDLKNMNDERNELNEKGPQIPKWAFKTGKKGIEKGEATYDFERR